ncbi:TPA: AarF/ABC1/UbiB kinase family protein [Candidatus Saccharibacteria bacterium]|nr:AarF/ABC1/UbiB kinase family protein [Candidatus Saccharibacteria bacterium]HIO87998.1 AarF/ABC1/UbiB kinase family protein [Candidatus Saccharibacteria bacterium]
MARRRRFRTTIKTVSKIMYHGFKGDEQSMNGAILDGFSDLGGVYVKFLQILSMKSDFFVGVDQTKLLAVFDNVEVDELDKDFILQFELKENIQHFKHIDPEPFAAGSFGQVYKAELTDGSKVAIKILRPSLMQNLKFDLRLLNFFTGLIKFVIPSAVYDVNEVYKDFKKIVKQETNYFKEADNALYFFERYKDHPHIDIPYTYKHLSSKYVLTQSFLDGIPFTKLIDLKNNGVNVEELVQSKYGCDLAFLVRMFGEEILRSVLTADFIQGDPHPGNVILLPNNKIGIMDFGITAPPPADRKAFVAIIENYIDMFYGRADMGKFFMDALRFYVSDLYRALTTLHRMYEKDESRDVNIKQEVKNVANKAFEETKDRVDVKQMLMKGQISSLFDKTLNEDNRFGIKANFDGAVMLRAAATYMSIIEGLGYREEMLPSVFEDVLKGIKKDGVEITGVSETMQVDRAVEIVSNWIEDITERDPFLFRDLIIKMRRRLSV